MNRAKENEDFIRSISSVLPNGTVSIADVSAFNAAVMIDISKSLAQIADALNPEPQVEDEQPTAQWVHSDAHKVCCSNCGAQVSMRAAYDMDYCFKCGRKMKKETL